MSEITDCMSFQMRHDLCKFIAAVSFSDGWRVRYGERFQLPDEKRKRYYRGWAELKNGQPVIYVDPQRNQTIDKWLFCVLHEIWHLGYDDFSHDGILVEPESEQMANEYASQHLDKWLAFTHKLLADKRLVKVVKISSVLFKE